MVKKQNLVYFVLIILLVIGIMFGNYMYNRHHASAVLNLYCWDNSFRELLIKYYPDYNPDTETIGDVQVNWIVVPNTDNMYQCTLDQAIVAAEKDAPNNRIDLFLVEADYIRKYCSSGDVCKPITELGVSNEELDEQFEYTKKLASDMTGTVRGVTWQATPGVVCYRRDIAKDVFGTDDPEYIQYMMRDWDSFTQMAAMLKAKGYRMLPGLLDTYRAFWSSAQKTWVNINGNIQIDKVMTDWENMTLNFTQSGYNFPNDYWDDNWCRQINGNTFCYFVAPWAIDKALLPLSKKRHNDNSSSFSKWAACQGPSPFYWGGTWICVYKNSDNADLIADIIQQLCFDKDNLKDIAKEHIEFVNNKNVMNELSNDPSMVPEFFNGQNPYPIMMNVAHQIKVSQVSGYDQGIHEAFQRYAMSYFRGEITKDVEWQQFLAAVWHKYPELQSTVVDPWKR